MRQQGLVKTSDIADELADRFGGELLDTAFHVRDLTRDSDDAADHTQEQLRKIELKPDTPRHAPVPADMPDTPRRKAYSFPELVFQEIHPSGKVAPKEPILAKGTILPTLPPQVLPTVFGTAEARAPIPGVGPSPSGPLNENALLTSTVCPMDRIANPDINPKPGTMGGSRRNDEIRVYASRFFDNNTVDLRPGVVGKQLATGLKPLNERIRPLYDAYRIPTGFSNSLPIGEACLTWGWQV